MTQSSLIHRLSWKAALLELKIATPANGSTPFVTFCPLCTKETLTIRDENSDGCGHWAQCSTCSFQGDLIALTAAVRKQTPETVILRLVRRGVLSAVDDRELQQYLQITTARQSLLNHWNTAQLNIYHTSKLRAVLSSLRLPALLESERWQAMAAQLSGLFVAEEGSNDTDALLLPFYDIPGRVRRLARVQRYENGEFELLFPRAFAGVGGSEGGLSYPPEIESTSLPYDGTLVAVSNPAVYLQLQFLNATMSGDFLPLVLWLPARSSTAPRTQQTWSTLTPFKLVFWETNPSLAALREAMRQNSAVYVSKIMSFSKLMRELSVTYTPRNALFDIIDQAKPWDVTLAELLSHERDPRLEEYLLRLRMDAPQTERLLQAMSPQNRQRAAKLLDIRRAAVVAHVGADCFVADDRGWWHQLSTVKQPTLVCDACVRIERIVIYKNSQENLYTGTILFRGQVLPFTTRGDAIRRDLFKWLYDELLQRKVGVVRWNPRWRLQAFNIAISFHQPRVSRGVTRVGWNRKKHALILPRGKLGTRGFIRNPDFTYDCNLPGAKFPCGKKIAEDAAAAWEREASKNAFWVSLISILENIFAEPLGLRPRPLLIVDPATARTASDVVESFGGLSYLLRSSQQIDTLAKKIGPHGWPHWLNCTSPVALNHWLASSHPAVKQTVTQIDFLSGCLNLLADRGILVTFSKAHIPKKIKKAIQGVLPAYLLRLTEAAPQMSESIGSNIRKFLQQEGLRSFIKLAGRYTPTIENRCIAFIEIAKKLLDPENTQTLPPVEAWKDDFAIRVPYGVIQEVAEKCGIASPLTADITALLNKQGLLVGLTDTAWLIRATEYRQLKFLSGLNIERRGRPKKKEQFRTENLHQKSPDPKDQVDLGSGDL